MPAAWLALALFLALGAALSYALSRRQQASAGLPAGRLVYEDTGAWRRCERPLFSREHQLAGKPDYLMERQGRLVPVEVKPERTAGQPYEGDVLQLAAYCLLVEEECGHRPCYGYLKYRERVFRIDYTDGVRRQLLTRLERMRRDLCARDVAPSHNEPRRCLKCGQRDHCGRPLA